MLNHESTFLRGLRLINQAQQAGAITFTDAVKLLRTLVAIR